VSDRHENDWTVGQNENVSVTRTYYAQTKTSPSTYTASFSK
jgi:hypothetical protein